MAESCTIKAIILQQNATESEIILGALQDNINEKQGSSHVM
jgi:hypothetical protein